MDMKMKTARKVKQAGDPGTENRPWVSNYPPLKEWLDKIQARPMWQLPQPVGAEGDDVQAYVEGWIAGSRIFVVHVWCGRQGWEIYTPCSDGTIPGTLADAEARIGWR